MENYPTEYNPTNAVAKRIVLSEKLGYILLQMHKLSIQQKECIEEIIATSEIIRSLGLDTGEFEALRLLKAQQSEFLNF